MVEAAVTAHVARAGQAALIVGAHMIEVALLGRPAAWPEPAGDVAGDDQLGDPRRRLVGGRGKLVTAATGLLLLTLLLGGGRCRPPGRREGAVHALPER